MSENNFIKLGAELKAKREEEDISLETINQKTRIDLKFLKAIDDGNFAIIDEVYIRAFIREYAKIVGLDPDKIIKKYELAKAGKLDESETGKESEMSDVVEEKIDEPKTVYTSEDFTGKMPNEEKTNSGIKKVLLLVGLGIILVGAVLYLVLMNDRPEIIKETPFEEILQKQKEEPAERFEVTEDTVTTMPPDSAVTGNKLILKIQARDTTWIRIIVDSSSPDEFILSPNSSKTIEADTKFNLLIGNAGGIDITLNNKPLNLVGKPGEIKSIQIDSSGIDYLKIKSKNKNE